MKAVLVLGSGPATKTMMELVRRSGYQPWQCSYGRRVAVPGAGYCAMKRGDELTSIRHALAGLIVVGVVNRFDSYIPLYGTLVEKFSLPGSDYESVQWFKDKVKMQTLMEDLGLQRYRPTTRVVAFDTLTPVLETCEMPVVVKPHMGSKSRGVMVVSKKSDINVVIDRLEQHFKSKKMFRTFTSTRMVLVEQFVGGTQLTYTGYVDERGKLTTVGFEDVVTGRDVGQHHQQLVYRTVPSQTDKDLQEEIEQLLTRLVVKAGLRSTFIFPEFKVEGKHCYLMELNVRIGGFRTEMYAYARGVDLAQATVQLALGQEVKLTSETNNSCTAVEVWQERSGKIAQIVLPEDERIKDLKIYIDAGAAYLSPPEGDMPLARFYVVDEEDSLKAARGIRARVRIDWASQI